ncbi:cobalt ECF transporter T component CbiQ [Accumulibacter sp.]|uniref:cobalt ECF transporter T component CbiQ n=1 Tax=Accumulibacter sp. TaxID=2053492 RepID=UPI0025ED2E04|nr:cobalt ECF transporter T component CbiQ [Accumulibacter sp.]MCM8611254.1 cobalt ECF transporter T component CbiQ [Accumulibacter sp.]MCM8635333.1 cobalt ECF transporter T component CbiQ [Accumulibacter sp.]MCM8638736.1 cobalt ECF transporter T component CbiQ [Accumulibacter sp.]
MARIDSSLPDLSDLDGLACRDSPIHRLDPRIKLLTTLLFIVCVVSFDKHQLSALLPFAAYPVVLLILARLPPAWILRKLLLAVPFALCVGIFNPLFDRTTLLHIGSLEISGGWVSFASIMLRFALTVSAALILVASTGFDALCLALARLGVPRPFVVQLLLLYRYLFVLVDEALRLSRARAQRSFAGRGMELTVVASLLAQLLLRTLDRAQRIYLAMQCRGFDGEVRLLRRLRIGASDVLFLTGWTAILLALRFLAPAPTLGQAIGRLLPS